MQEWIGTTVYSIFVQLLSTTGITSAMLGLLHYTNAIKILVGGKNTSPSKRSCKEMIAPAHKARMNMNCTAASGDKEVLAKAISLKYIEVPTG